MNSFFRHDVMTRVYLNWNFDIETARRITDEIFKDSNFLFRTLAEYGEADPIINHTGEVETHLPDTDGITELVDRSLDVIENRDASTGSLSPEDWKIVEENLRNIYDELKLINGASENIASHIQAITNFIYTGDEEKSIDEI